MSAADQYEEGHSRRCVRRHRATAAKHGFLTAFSRPLLRTLPMQTDTNAGHRSANRRFARAATIEEFPRHRCATQAGTGLSVRESNANDHGGPCRDAYEHSTGKSHAQFLCEASEKAMGKSG